MFAPGSKHETKKGFNDLFQGPTLGGILKSAIEQRKTHSPAKVEPGMRKPQYANYYERKQGEEVEFQKDLVKKGLVGHGLKEIMNKNHT